MEITPKKSLGQHFLTSKSALFKIIEAAELSFGELVLEIGPGTGILTQELLNKGVFVIAIEKDDRAVVLLKEKFAAEIQDGKLTLFHQDILEANIADLLEKCSKNDTFSKKYKIIANIPYYITGAILEKFLENEPRAQKIVLLVQKEVAQRIVAKDGKESVLSISVKAFGDPKIVGIVPKGAFNPPPTVDSAIILIENLSDATIKQNGIEIARFFGIVKAGFAHKRKLLRRNLESVSTSEKIDEVWKALNMDQNIRAEQITAKQWLEIVKSLSY